jgi:nicotinamidase-related amidase
MASFLGLPWDVPGEGASGARAFSSAVEYVGMDSLVASAAQASPTLCGVRSLSALPSPGDPAQLGETTIYKARYSGFYGTELGSVLKQYGTQWLIVTGATTSICVESTIRDAMFRDYSCILLADCTGEPIGPQSARSNHEASLLTIQTLFGWVSSSAEVIRSLQQSGR